MPTHPDFTLVSLTPSVETKLELLANAGAAHITIGFEQCEKLVEQFTVDTDTQGEDRARFIKLVVPMLTNAGLGLELSVKAILMLQGFPVSNHHNLESLVRKLHSESKLRMEDSYRELFSEKRFPHERTVAAWTKEQDYFNFDHPETGDFWAALNHSATLYTTWRYSHERLARQPLVVGLRAPFYLGICVKRELERCIDLAYVKKAKVETDGDTASPES
ncbi:MAG: hypothetical protein AAFQ62_10600 [Pseudomonadota bacterium]